MSLRFLLVFFLMHWNSSWAIIDADEDTDRQSALRYSTFAPKLRSLPLGLVKALHVEGGPEASLSLKGADMELHLSGSYEAGFNENDFNARQWPLPNVLGVRRKSPIQQADK